MMFLPVSTSDKDMMRPLCVLHKDGSIPETCTYRDEHQHCEKPKKDKKDKKAGKGEGSELPWEEGS